MEQFVRENRIEFNDADENSNSVNEDIVADPPKLIVEEKAQEAIPV